MIDSYASLSKQNLKHNMWAEHAPPNNPLVYYAELLNCYDVEQSAVMQAEQQQFDVLFFHLFPNRNINVNNNIT